MRKTILVAFAAVLQVYAKTEVIGGYTWTYRVVGNTAEIYNNGYAAISPSPTGVVTIPDTLGGKTVASIGECAFLGCSSLTGVTIPGSVRNIGSYAFNGCHEFSSVIIPDSVTNIEARAFYFCGSLTNVTIGDGVISVGNEAFYGCGKLVSVKIGKNVARIGAYAFSACNDELFDTTTISGVKLVDGWVVGYTDSLPDDLNLVGVRGIGEYTFWDCRGLTSVMIGGGVRDIGNWAFTGCSGLTNVIIGSSVTNIGYGAFNDCKSLADVSISDNVASIGNDAFAYCSGLAGVTIPNGVTSIGDSAFYDCSGLTSIVIPDSVTYIGSGAFSGCSGLENVTIPASVTRLSEVFPSACHKITNVVMSENVTNIGANAFANCSGLISVTIPDSVTTIGESAFNGCVGLVSVVIPDSVVSIGNDAFSHCSELTNATIGDSTTNIGSYAFAYCSGLTNMVIGSAVTHIGNSAFFNCGGLMSVLISDSVAHIGDSAFDYCRELTSLTFLGDAPEMGGNAFSGVSPDCCAYVCRASSGWGVDIPGTWQRIGIDYIRSIISFDANGGSGGSSDEMYCGMAIVAPVVSRTGYTFAGWFPALDIMVPLTNVTYTAQWRINQYMVTFDANGGIGGRSEALDYGSEIVAPTVVRAGYTFAGWMPDVDTVVPASNVTYTAQWQINMKIAYAYPFSKAVDFTSGNGFFGCAIPDNIITNTDAQPLAEEWSGMQVQIDPSGLDDIDLESIEVHMAWFKGESPWGWKNWIGKAKEILLERAADWSASKLVYRSNPDVRESFIPPILAGDDGCQTLQYHIWVTFKDKTGKLQDIRHLGDSDLDWRRPYWYDPVDKNKDYGTFSAYTILDRLSPRCVWLNEVNVYRCGDKEDYAHQYVEIAAPLGYDLTGWSVEAIRLGDGYDFRTLFTLGYGVTSFKTGPRSGNYVFYAIQSPETAHAGTYGPLDGVWNSNFSRYGGRMEIGCPYALRLVRPSGIVEHEIVFETVNPAAGGYLEYLFSGTNYLEEVKRNVCSGDTNQWFYAGADNRGYSGGDCSLGVFTGRGEPNTWKNEIVQTPGEANLLADGSRQLIDQDYNRWPSATNLWIYASISSGSENGMSMVVGGETNRSAVIVATQDFCGTYGTIINGIFTVIQPSIVYLIKDGFEIDSVKANGEIVAEASGATQKWTFDLGNLKASNLNRQNITIDASVCLLGRPKDPIPEIASHALPEVVEMALAGSNDIGLFANITNAMQYAAYRTWAMGLSSVTAEEVKASPAAWLSYALDADSLIAAAPKEGDLKIDSFESSSTDGAFEFTVKLKDIAVGYGALEDNLKKVFDIEGREKLSSGEFSSDAVQINAAQVDNGNVKFTVTPKVEKDEKPTSFFFKAKMK